MLLSDSGIKVSAPKFLDRTKYNATKIRSMIVHDENWTDYVPPEVSKIISRINGINRLKIISKSDTKPTEH